MPMPSKKLSRMMWSCKDASHVVRDDSPTSRSLPVGWDCLVEGLSRSLPEGEDPATLGVRVTVGLVLETDTVSVDAQAVSMSGLPCCP